MESSNQDIPELIAQLRALKEFIPQDESLRRSLLSTMQEVSLALEKPLDTVRRIAFSPLQLTIAKVAIDLGIFRLLNENASGMSTHELVVATKANAILLTRILRYLAAVNMVAEPTPSFYTVTNITRTLSHPDFQAGVEHQSVKVQSPLVHFINHSLDSFDAQLPAWLALPSFLAISQYANPSDPTRTAFQLAHKTDLPAFQWASTKPRVMRDFALWMSAQRTGQRSWLDVFPFDDFCKDQISVEIPLFVDIGGGVGHQCRELKAQLPETGRKIVLQDLPSVLAHAVPVEGIEQMPYDLWDDQPVHGASYYYLRNVLHDYPTQSCLTLLRNVKAAMEPHSTLIIDELVLPDVGAHWQAAQLDIGMMSSLAGMERCETDWRDLLEKSGLRVKEVLFYEEALGDGVIIAVLP